MVLFWVGAWGRDRPDNLRPWKYELLPGVDNEKTQVFGHAVRGGMSAPADESREEVYFRVQALEAGGFVEQLV